MTTRAEFLALCSWDVRPYVEAFWRRVDGGGNVAAAYADVWPLLNARESRALFALHEAEIRASIVRVKGRNGGTWYEVQP